MLRFFGIALVFGMLASTGCARARRNRAIARRNQAQAEFYQVKAEQARQEQAAEEYFDGATPPAPPTGQTEVQPARPSGTHVWVAGSYARRRGTWVWVPGRWVKPPRARAVWVQPRWVKRGHRWVWVAGRWR